MTNKTGKTRNVAGSLPDSHTPTRPHSHTAPDAVELRRLAEERLKEKQRGQKSEEDPARLVHELKVHQIELEMQNEELKRAHGQAEQLIQELQTALTKVKLLSGLVPICANCKKIRDDQGYWKQLESYIESHSEATFTHGTCPKCLDKFCKEVEAVVPGPVGDDQ